MVSEGENEKAKECYEKLALEIKPHDLQTQIKILGLIYSKDWEIMNEAKKCYEKVIDKVNPN